MRRQLRTLNLQAKIILVLISVITPTFMIVTVAENKLTKPVLEEEVKQMGITAGKTMAAQIVSQRLLSLQNPTPAIESYIQELVYSQPNVIQVDVLVKDPYSGVIKNIASNVDEEPE